MEAPTLLAAVEGLQAFMLLHQHCKGSGHTCNHSTNIFRILLLARCGNSKAAQQHQPRPWERGEKRTLSSKSLHEEFALGSCWVQLQPVNADADDKQRQKAAEIQGRPPRSARYTTAIQRPTIEESTESVRQNKIIPNIRREE